MSSLATTGSRSLSSNSAGWSLADAAALIPRQWRMRSAVGPPPLHEAASNLFGVAKRERARIAAPPPAKERPRSSTRPPAAESCGRTDSKPATSKRGPQNAGRPILFG